MGYVLFRGTLPGRLLRAAPRDSFMFKRVVSNAFHFQLNMIKLIGSAIVGVAKCCCSSVVQLLLHLTSSCEFPYQSNNYQPVIRTKRNFLFRLTKNRRVTATIPSTMKTTLVAITLASLT